MNWQDYLSKICLDFGTNIIPITNINIKIKQKLSIISFLTLEKNAKFGQARLSPTCNC